MGQFILFPSNVHASEWQSERVAEKRKSRAFLVKQLALGMSGGVKKTVVTVSIRFEPSSYLRLTSYMWSGCVLFYCFTQQCSLAICYHLSKNRKSQTLCAARKGEENVTFDYSYTEVGQTCRSTTDDQTQCFQRIMLSSVCAGASDFTNS